MESLWKNRLRHTGSVKLLESLPGTFRSELLTFFSVIESYNDISILSDKEFTHFFYYAEPKHEHLHKSIITLCENLDKKLLVIHDKTNPITLPPEHITAEYYHVESNNASEWLSQIKLRYFSTTMSSEAVLSGDLVLKKNGKPNFSDVVSYIANNAHKDLREEEAAALCHYSPNYFSKLFHRKVGIVLSRLHHGKAHLSCQENAYRRRLNENCLYCVSMRLP